MSYTLGPRLFAEGLQSMGDRFLFQVVVHRRFSVKMRDSMATIESRPDKVLYPCSLRGIHEVFTMFRFLPIRSPN